MKKILYIGVIFTLLSSLNACDYNDRNFEGLDDMVKPSVQGPFQLEYAEKVFSAESPAKNVLPDWLYSQVYTADTGSIAVVKYKFSEPTVKSVMSENFERTALAGGKTEIVGWVNNTVKGEKFWCNKISLGSWVTEFSAYNKSAGECEGWLISPKVAVTKGMTLTFDLCIKKYNADCLKVFISSNFNGYMNATWEDVTDGFKVPSANMEMGNAGVLKLDNWVKKDIVVAFQYVGDGANAKTTTVQLDNITINVADSKISDKEDEYVFKGHTDKWVFVREVPKYALKENLERTIVSKQPTVLPGWLNVAKAGTLRWYDKEYKNVYTEFSAFSATEPCDAWLITPKLNIFDEMIFSFDACIGYYTADCLTVLISTDFSGEEGGIDGATWIDVTSSFEIPKEPVSGYGKMLPVGKMDMKEYLDKNIYIAFRYQGSKAEGKTTTIQLDNFFVGKE